jgi:hypothetical protein
VFAALRFHERLIGRLAELAWRIEPVLLDVRSAGGAVTTWRIIPATAEDGLLMSPLPLDLGQFMDLLEGAGAPRVEAIRIHGPGTGSYEDTVDVVWRAAPPIP